MVAARRQTICAARNSATSFAASELRVLSGPQDRSRRPVHLIYMAFYSCPSIFDRNVACVGVTLKPIAFRL